MKTSLVIPSTEYHFQHIESILTHFAQGTVVPDQVIISVSNAHLIPCIWKDDIISKFVHVFEDIEIILHDEWMDYNINRKAASLKVSNELIIYSDSDDLPHPQRIEVIKYFFANHDILHLNHAWSYKKNFHGCKFKCNEIKYIESDDIFSRYFPEQKHLEQKDRIRKNRPKKPVQWYGEGPWNFVITGGHTAFLREVLKEVQWVWPHEVASDYDFCMDVLFHFNKSMLVESPLIWYNRKRHALLKGEKFINMDEAVWTYE